MDANLVDAFSEFLGVNRQQLADIQREADVAYSEAENSLTAT